MKTTLFAVCCFFFTSAICFSNPLLIALSPEVSSEPVALKTVALFLEIPDDDPSYEEARLVFPEKTIPLFPKQLFNVLPFKKTDMAVRTYKKKNNMIIDQFLSAPMESSDIQKVGRELNCDYVLWVKAAFSHYRRVGGLLSTTIKSTVTADFRLINVETMHDLIHTEIIKPGSISLVVGTPSEEFAYSDALKKAVAEFQIPQTTLLEMSSGSK